MPGVLVNFRQSDSHLSVDRYGDFFLTDAVRPGPGVPVIPREGYRPGVYKDHRQRLRIPVLSAAASREKLFDLFLALIKPLGREVDVILETSHRRSDGKHRDLRRRGIDTPVLASYCCEFEDLLLNDGCTGIAVLAAKRQMEVQLDEHKLIFAYAPSTKPFRRILRSFGVYRDDGLKLISEAPHLHGTEPYYHAEFRDLCARIGAGSLALKA